MGSVYELRQWGVWKVFTQSESVQPLLDEVLHLSCAIAIPLAYGDHRAKGTAEIVLSLYIRAKIEAGDVEALSKMLASAARSNHPQTSWTYREG